MDNNYEDNMHLEIPSFVHKQNQYNSQIREFKIKLTKFLNEKIEQGISVDRIEAIINKNIMRNEGIFKNKDLVELTSYFYSKYVPMDKKEIYNDLKSKSINNNRVKLDKKKSLTLMSKKLIAAGIVTATLSTALLAGHVKSEIEFSKYLSEEFSDQDDRKTEVVYNKASHYFNINNMAENVLKAENARLEFFRVLRIIINDPYINNERKCKHLNSYLKWLSLFQKDNQAAYDSLGLYGIEDINELMNLFGVDGINELLEHYEDMAKDEFKDSQDKEEKMGR